ncbi:MAG TPA: LuxR C-terminal-related transcriptional regulator [Dehalococcoidia bacterium]
MVDAPAGDAKALVREARELLGRGAWAEARDALQKALAQEESAEALEAFALSCWWLDDYPAMFDCRERAFRLYRAAGDNRAAARMATTLGSDTADHKHELAVASGWFQRARSLLTDVDPCPEHGWLELLEGFCVFDLEDDLPRVSRMQQAALAWAERLSLFDLHMLAVILEGAILVRSGNVAEGMRRVDEAMTAAVSGEMNDLAAISSVCCGVIGACESIADYDRAVQWCDRAREFASRWGLTSLFAVCRTSYATVLTWRGQWLEAEAELASSARELETRRPANALEAIAKLAELRRRQGRHVEAEELLRQAEGHNLSLLGKAALALDRNDCESALDLIRRFLRRINEQQMAENVFAQELATRARVALGQLSEAEQESGKAVAIAEAVGTAALRASAALTAGVYLLASGDADSARENLEDAIDLFTSVGAPFDASRARLDLSKALAALGRDEAAMQQAGAALECFEQLGATHHAMVARSIVRGGDGRIALRQTTLLPGLTARESEVLWLLAEGKTNQDIADDLVLSVRTVERHISTIYEKIDVHGKAARAAATAFALKHARG